MPIRYPKASERMGFVDVTPGEASPTYERIGKGFDTSTPSSNTTTQANQFIDEDNTTTIITGKSIQRAISGKRAVGDAFNDYFCSLFDKIGSDCETTMVIADKWDSEDDIAYPAKKYNIVIDCDNDGGGSATDGLPISGTIYFNGDPVEGAFNINTKEFTPNP